MPLMHQSQARALLVAAGACLAVMAYGFALSKAGRTGDDWWPWWFAAAAASCVVLATFLWSRVALSISGLLVVLGFAAKALGVVVDLDAGLAPDRGRAIAGVAVWAFFALMCSVVWIFVLAPVVSWAGQQHRKG